MISKHAAAWDKRHPHSVRMPFKTLFEARWAADTLERMTGNLCVVVRIPISGWRKEYSIIRICGEKLGRG